MNSGRPCEDRVITESFQRLRERVELPNVVFHSLRHSSTTYKLKLIKGDLKATQGDTDHAEIDMITKVCFLYQPCSEFFHQRLDTLDASTSMNCLTKLFSLFAIKNKPPLFFILSNNGGLHYFFDSFQKSRTVL